jgi:aconitate hydratase
LGVFGDSLTTDHISPAGNISRLSVAGKYLLEQGISAENFNSYGSRRGNHEVMMRGTFANIRIKNLLVSGKEGGITVYFPDKTILPIYTAAMQYKANSIPTIIIGGKEYGSGSSRDWAAKGTYLLGVKAVLAESYERIHHSNLVGMGVLPLQFKEKDNFVSLALTGEEIYDIFLPPSLSPKQEITIEATHPVSQKKTEFSVIVRLDTPVEIDYYRQGGILQIVLKNFLSP